MAIRKLDPPTRSEMEREIASYEKQYGITTADFLALVGRFHGIDEDDAVEWLFRIEQLRVLDGH